MQIDPATASRLDEAGRDFTLAVLREETSRHPRNAEALRELGHLLTRLGRCEEGLRVDLRLAVLEPSSPIVFYNLACTYALLARLDEAFEALRRAIELGFDDRELLARDEDLERVRADARYGEILSLLRRSRSSR